MVRHRRETSDTANLRGIPPLLVRGIDMKIVEMTSGGSREKGDGWQATNGKSRYTWDASDIGEST